MPSGSIYGPGGAFGAPGPTTYAPTGQQPTQQPLTQTTGSIFGPGGAFAGSQNPALPATDTGGPAVISAANSGTPFSWTPGSPIPATSTVKDYTTTQSTQSPLYAGAQGVGNGGLGEGNTNGYGYLNPRDRVANSLFNYKLGGGTPGGMFRL
jgi:hypothetical protein